MSTITTAKLVLIGSGSVTGTFAALTQPVAGLPPNARFDAIYGANSIFLAVTASSTDAKTMGTGSARSYRAHACGRRDDGRYFANAAPAHSVPLAPLHESGP